MSNKRKVALSIFLVLFVLCGATVCVGILVGGSVVLNYRYSDSSVPSTITLTAEQVRTGKTETVSVQVELTEHKTIATGSRMELPYGMYYISVAVDSASVSDEFPETVWVGPFSDSVMFTVEHNGGELVLKETDKDVFVGFDILVALIFLGSTFAFIFFSALSNKWEWFFKYCKRFVRVSALAVVFGFLLYAFWYRTADFAELLPYVKNVVFMIATIFAIREIYLWSVENLEDECSG